MAEPMDFKEKNATLLKPEAMSDEECIDLPVFKDDMQIISKWKFTEDELVKIAENGYIWLVVLSNTSQPPMKIIAEETVFEEKSKIILPGGNTKPTIV